MKVIKFVIKGIQHVKTKDKEFFFLHCQALVPVTYCQGDFFINVYQSAPYNYLIGDEIDVVQNGRYWNILER